MLIMKGIINDEIVALNYNLRKVVSHHIFSSYLVLDLNVKL